MNKLKTTFQLIAGLLVLFVVLTVVDNGSTAAASPNGKIINVNDLVAVKLIESSYSTTIETTGPFDEFGFYEFSFDVEMTNVSESVLSNLCVVVEELTQGNLLRNADRGPGGKGSIITVQENGILNPDESVDVHFDISLAELKQFKFLISILGAVNEIPVFSDLGSVPAAIPTSATQGSFFNVLFTAKLAGKSVRPTEIKVELQEFDESGKLLGTLGELGDEGLFGDHLKGDKVYSRKIPIIPSEEEETRIYRVKSTVSSNLPPVVTDPPYYFHVTGFRNGIEPSDPRKFNEEENGLRSSTTDILVFFAQGTSPKRIREIVNDIGVDDNVWEVDGTIFGVIKFGEDNKTILGNGIYKLQLKGDIAGTGDPKVVEDAISALLSKKEVVSAGKNYFGHLAHQDPSYTWPNDPDFNLTPAKRWAQERIHLQEALQLSDGNEVIVAILDSGVYYDHEKDEGHEDLVGRVITNSLIDLNGDGVQDDFNDTYGHGTHMAGIIGANAGNVGIVGITRPNIEEPKILPIKIAANNEWGNLELAILEKAITEAADFGAKIINVSAGWSPGNLSIVFTEYSDLFDVINEIGDQVLLVAAAGNHDSEYLDVPAYFTKVNPARPKSKVATRVIAVGGTDNLENRFSLTCPGGSTNAASSNHGGLVDIVAPGENIYSTIPPTGFAACSVVVKGVYAFATGTSQATAMVSGAAAHVMSQYDLNAVDVKTRLVNNVEYKGGISDFPNPIGRLDIFKALCPSSDTTAPTIPEDLELSGIVGSSQVDLTWSPSIELESILTHYNIYRDGEPLEESTSTSFSDTDVAIGNTYEYEITAVDCSGNESDMSDVLVIALDDTTPPTAPTNLTAAVFSRSEINLNWIASTDNVGVSGYNIYRDGTKIATSGTISYLDTDLTPSETYTYTVSAFDAAANESGQSNSFDISIGAPLIPELEFLRSENVVVRGNNFVRYWLSITNRSIFPDELFVPNSDLQPCGSRTWVNIYNTAGTRSLADDSYIYGFCAVTSPEQLDQIWFAVLQGDAPPTEVYVELLDRLESIVYRSNSVSIPITIE